MVRGGEGDGVGFGDERGVARGGCCDAGLASDVFTGAVFTGAVFAVAAGAAG